MVHPTMTTPNERKQFYMNTKCRYEDQSLVKRSKHVVRGALALLLLPPVAAWAGGAVTNCTEAALREAMAGGGVVTFACDGTITLANTITNVVDTTLDASGRQVTISGSNAVRVFYINTNNSFTVLNLTIADGKSQGGSAIFNLGGSVNLTGVFFRSNTAVNINVPNDGLTTQASGGAIFNRGGTVAASNCSFVSNAAQTLATLAPAEAWGGAIRNEAGQVDLRSCAFVGNLASGRAGSFAVFPSPSSPGFGGAIHNSGALTLDLCSFAGNSASGGSGYDGIALSHPGGYPGSEGSGGAIFNQGTVTTDRTTLSGNTAMGGNGGAGVAGNASAHLQRGPGGTAGSANGAGICNLGLCWITRSTFASNVITGGVGGAGGMGAAEADYGGGAGGSGGSANGAAICNSGSLWVTGSTFASNVVTGGIGGAGGLGAAMAFPYDGGDGGRGGDGGSGLAGALFNSGAASLVNCTIAFNTGSGGTGGVGGQAVAWPDDQPHAGGAGGNGGSGFGGVDGTCDLTNCTVAWNRGNGGSGGVGGVGGAGTPTNWITPGASGTNGAAWGGTACSPLVNTLIVSNTPAGGDSFPDPKLGPLADNGGPTLTMALLPGSPAIDAGDTSLAPATDQRGVPRPFSLAADIGAFEFWPTLRASPAGSGGIDILASGISGQTCRLLASSNLLNWMAFATNQFGTNGTFLFYDYYAPGSACRFYRLVMP